MLGLACSVCVGVSMLCVLGALWQMLQFKLETHHCTTSNPLRVCGCMCVCVCVCVCGVACDALWELVGWVKQGPVILDV